MAFPKTLSIEERMKRARKAVKKIKEIEPNFSFDVDLKDFSTMKIGGKAACIVSPTADSIAEMEEKLSKIYHFCANENLECYPLGNGANTVFSDVPGVILLTKNLDKFWVDKNIIKAMCGASLAKLSRAAKNSSLSGLEFAIGIPGTIGGAVTKNASCYLQSTGNIIQSAQTIGVYGDYTIDRICALKWEKINNVKVNGKIFIEQKDTLRSFETKLGIGTHISDNGFRSLNFGYRESPFTRGDLRNLTNHSPDYFRELVYLVELELKPAGKKEISERMQQNILHRANHQPKGLSIGSIFKRRQGYSNPNDQKGVGPYSAEDLIKEAGCEPGPEGLRAGDIYLAEQNSNHFINAGNGTIGHFMALLASVRGQVYEKTGVQLEIEADVLPEIGGLW